MASTKLTRTFSADSNRKKFTVSVWVKKSQHASAKVIWGGEISTGYVWLNLGSTLYFQQNPSSSIEFNSTAKFRDPSGWYHIVQQVDHDELPIARYTLARYWPEKHSAE